MNKKLFLLSTFIMLSILLVAGCQKQEAQTNSASTTLTQGSSSDNATKNDETYDRSKLYTEKELNDALNVIQEEVGMWEGVALANIRYAGDEVSNKENLARMNELGNDKNYTQVCEFITDVVVADNAPAGPWEAGKNYKDYAWWLARKDNGEWSLITWGNS